MKRKVIESIVFWAKNFSEESSGGEYEFEEFHLDLSIGSYQNHDNWCYINEESKGKLIDLSVLEINKQELYVEIF